MTANKAMFGFILPDRLTVGLRPLEAAILVRIQVRQLSFAKAME